MERLTQTEEVLAHTLNPDQLLLEGLGGIVLIHETEEPEEDWAIELGSSLGFD